MKILSETESLKNQHENKTISVINLSLIIVIALMLSACSAHVVHKPDNHHQSNEPSVSIEYFYYPSMHVYYDNHRHLYHYHDKHRGWLTVRVLPSHIRLHGHRHHTLHSRNNKPWKQNHRNKRHRSHIEPGYRHVPRRKEKQHKQLKPSSQHTPRREDRHQGHVESVKNHTPLRKNKHQQYTKPKYKYAPNRKNKNQEFVEPKQQPTSSHKREQREIKSGHRKNPYQKKERDTAQRKRIKYRN